jgi:hypothetical protein
VGYSTRKNIAFDCVQLKSNKKKKLTIPNLVLICYKSNLIVLQLMLSKKITLGAKLDQARNLKINQAIITYSAQQ